MDQLDQMIRANDLENIEKKYKEHQTARLQGLDMPLDKTPESSPEKRLGSDKKPTPKRRRL